MDGSNLTPRAFRVCLNSCIRSSPGIVKDHPATHEELRSELCTALCEKGTTARIEVSTYSIVPRICQPLPMDQNRSESSSSRSVRSYRLLLRESTFDPTIYPHPDEVLFPEYVMSLILADWRSQQGGVSNKHMCKRGVTG